MALCPTISITIRLTDAAPAKYFAVDLSARPYIPIHLGHGEDYLYVFKPGLTARTRHRAPLRAPGRELPPALWVAGA